MESNSGRRPDAYKDLRHVRMMRRAALAAFVNRPSRCSDWLILETAQARGELDEIDAIGTKRVRGE